MAPHHISMVVVRLPTEPPARHLGCGTELRAPMSAQSDVARLRKAVEDLHRKIAAESGKVSTGRERAAKAQQQAAKASSPSTASTKLGEAERRTREANDAERRRSRLQGSLADKQKALHRAEAKLETERATEHKRALERLEEQARRQERQFRLPVDQLAEFGESPMAERAASAPPAHDVFIAHASEDKDEIARPLAELLVARGVDVWYDEFSLSVGDSLRRSIDQGLASSRFGVVILSKNFFNKEWPQTELDGLAAKERSSGTKVILPIWHRVTKDDVLERSPTLADKLALNTAVSTMEEIADQVASVVTEHP